MFRFAVRKFSNQVWRFEIIFPKCRFQFYFQTKKNKSTFKFFETQNFACRWFFLWVQNSKNKFEILCFDFGFQKISFSLKFPCLKSGFRFGKKKNGLVVIVILNVQKIFLNLALSSYPISKKNCSEFLTNPSCVFLVRFNFKQSIKFDVFIFLSF